MSNTTKSAAGVQGAPATKTTEKTELSKFTIPPPKKAAANIDEIKKKVEDYSALLEKHSILSETKKKLDSFAIGSDENNQNLRISDKDGNQFTTGNPMVIKEVIELIRKQLNTQCGVIETEVLNFII